MSNRFNYSKNDLNDIKNYKRNKKLPNRLTTSRDKKKIC